MVRPTVRRDPAFGECVDGILSVDDQRDLDEPCPDARCQLVELLDELRSTDELWNDDVVTHREMRSRHRPDRRRAGVAPRADSAWHSAFHQGTPGIPRVD